MENSILQIIKISFEEWYNKNIAKDNYASIVINYKDAQTLTHKAYHTVTLEMTAVHIENEQPVVTPLITLKENYNHGVTSEEEIKERMTEKLMKELYGYKDAVA